MCRSNGWIWILGFGLLLGCGEEFAATGAGAGGQPTAGQGGTGATTSVGGGDAGAGNLGGGQPAGGSGGGVPCGSRTFTEDFSKGGQFPWDPWDSYWAAPQLLVSQEQLELHFAPSDDNLWYLAYTTGEALNLTDCAVSVRLAAPPTDDAPVDMELVFFGLGSNPDDPGDDDYITLGIGPSYAYAEEPSSGFWVDTEPLYLPTNYPYVRIREAGGTVYFEKSETAESDSWTPIFDAGDAVLATPAFVTAGYIELGAGVEEGVIAEGDTLVVAFDDVNLP